MTDASHVIGLTGGIACGKSEVEKRLRDRWKIPVLDTDTLGHELLRADSPVHSQLMDTFGSGILDAEGHVDRRKLGERVFSNPEERSRLNDIVHPVIRSRWQRWCEERTEPLSVVSIPLLFECGYQTYFNGVLCIWAPESQMIQRLTSRGLDQNEALQRIRSQWPVARKAELSDWVIKNDFTLDHLHEQVDRWVQLNSPGIP